MRIWYPPWGIQPPSYVSAKKWATKFRQGGNLLEEDPRSERPVTVNTKEMIGKVHDIIVADRRVPTDNIAKKLDTSRERIQAIIHNELRMPKRQTRWVPKLLGH